MIPHIQYSLNVNAEGVYVRYTDEPNQPYEKHLRRLISSVDEFVQFLQDRINKFKLDPESLIIIASSSMDFPQEYTNDPKVIALASELRK